MSANIKAKTAGVKYPNETRHILEEKIYKF